MFNGKSSNQLNAMVYGSWVMVYGFEDLTANHPDGLEIQRQTIQPA